MSFMKMVLLLMVICLLFQTFPVNANGYDFSPCKSKSTCDDDVIHVDCNDLGLVKLPDWTTSYSRNSSACTKTTSLRLYLNNNKMAFPDNLMNLETLEWLEMSNNGMMLSGSTNKSYRSRVKSLIKLLDLTSNSISRLVNGTLIGLTSLRNLYLWDNGLRYLEAGWANGLHNLTHLILSHNNLRSISSYMFSGLRQLRTLSLQGNQISFIDESWSADLQNLENLDLSYNNITSYTGNMFMGLPSLQILNMKQIPQLKINWNAFAAISSPNVVIYCSTNDTDQHPALNYNISHCYVTMDYDDGNEFLTFGNVYLPCKYHFEISVYVIQPILYEDHQDMESTPYQPKWLLWMLPFACVALIVAIVATANSLRLLIKRHREQQVGRLYIELDENYCFSNLVHQETECRTEGRPINSVSLTSNQGLPQISLASSTCNHYRVQTGPMESFRPFSTRHFSDEDDMTVHDYEEIPQVVDLDDDALAKTDNSYENIRGRTFISRAARLRPENEGTANDGNFTGHGN